MSLNREIEIDNSDEVSKVNLLNWISFNRWLVEYLSKGQHNIYEIHAFAKGLGEHDVSVTRLLKRGKEYKLIESIYYGIGKRYRLTSLTESLMLEVDKYSENHNGTASLQS